MPNNPPSETEAARVLRALRDSGCQQLRLMWPDLHGRFHGKTITPRAFESTLKCGIQVASSLGLKDASGRTAFPVFEAAQMDAFGLSAFALVGDMWLRPDLQSLRMLPWASHTAWLRCDALHLGGSAIAFEPRQAALQAQTDLAAQGFAARWGLEVEFHVWRLRPEHTPARAASATWPAAAPLPEHLQLLHGGHQLLGELEADASHEVLVTVQEVCAALALPLASLEIEFGPSQFEAVFEVQDALAACDAMLLFRSAVAQALARKGYVASFMCKPPLGAGSSMASGWHVHQSWVGEGGAANAFASQDDAPLSATGMHALAGLLAHASALCAIAVPTVGGYARFAPGALAPTRICWGADSRAAMLRVVGQGAATRIENRLPEPQANPYLLFAAQTQAMLHGLHEKLNAPPASLTPYAEGAPHVPASLGDALGALAQDAIVRGALGAGGFEVFERIKRQELARHAQSSAPEQWLWDEHLSL